MCGRFAVGSQAGEILNDIGLQLPRDWRPHYNVAPSQPVLALRQQRGGVELAHLKWGLIPAWSKDASIGRRLVMARADTIETKPAFFDAFRHRRCALLSDGFYEWRRDAAGSTPFYFRFTKPLAIGAIWERWLKYGHDVSSCAVITTTANATVAPVHDRMPVLLDRESLNNWLDERTPLSRVRELLNASPAGYVRAFAADKAVNNPANDSAELLGEYVVEARMFGRVLA